MLDPRHHLVSDRPAEVWADAYPLGNGHLGAMSFGRPGTDRLQINDSDVWRGRPIVRSLAPGAAAGFREARAAALRGDLAAAEAATARTQSGNAQKYQPFLDLEVRNSSVDEDSPVRRTLDLRTGIARTVLRTAEHAGTTATTVSAADDVLLDLRRFASPSDLRLEITSVHEQELHLDRAGTAPRLVGRLKVAASIDPSVGGNDMTRPPQSFEESVHASWALEIRTDGEIQEGGVGVLLVSGARQVELRLASRTQFDLDGTLRARNDEDLESMVLEQLESLATLDGADLLERAAASHAEMYGRLDLALATEAERPEVPEGGEQTTEARLDALRDGSATIAQEADLVALLAGMGRYLMITGARGDTLPLNLQGIWNEDENPAWFSDYTTNINLEMNYWPAGPANLVDAGTGLTRWSALLADRGRRVAREIYDADGWTVHHNSDRWGYAAPVGLGKDSPSWSAWPMGGAWVSSTIVDLHRFSPQGVPPAVRELHADAVRFVLDILVPMPDGSLGTAPSTSPENLFHRPGQEGARHAVHVSTTADLALARMAILALLETMADHDPQLTERAQDALSRLPRETILDSGLLAEWSDPALIDVEPLHRHTSHLIGLYPGSHLDPRADPERGEAARRSLDARGFESTGWALAWRICLAARLEDGDLAARYIRRFLHPVDGGREETAARTPPSRLGGVHRSLLCSHPPFQIDGNFGALAGILELLVQSHRGSRQGDDTIVQVDLLPACPPDWTSGRLRGTRIRGGAELDLQWDGSGVRATFRSAVEQRLDVRLGADSRSLDLVPGEDRFLRWDGSKSRPEHG